MNKNHYIVLGAIILLLSGFGLWYFTKPKMAYANIEQFAQCLRDKGAVMYGAYWCPHCQREKAAFGEAFKFVSYVECTQDTQKFTDAGIKGYPTWIFPDGRRFEGELGLEGLSKESGCVLEAVK